MPTRDGLRGINRSWANRNENSSPILNPSSGAVGGVMSWEKPLDRRVVLPDGKALRTLDDARRHILALPKSEHETTAWQVGIEALLDATAKADPEQGTGAAG